MGRQDAIEDMEEKFIQVGAHKHPEKKWAKSHAMIAKFWQSPWTPTTM
jgi:hypothetical protein